MIDKFTVRDARAEEAADIGGLNTRAFGCEDEARIVERLRKDGDVLMELVATMDDQVVGHALFYSVGVFQRLGACGLGPMCVDPWVQREGIGAGLLDYGLANLKAWGVPLVFVLGHADYYPKFGFKVSTTDPFDTPIKGPNFMAVRLRQGPPMAGKLIFPAAFGIPRSA
ncbi:MAG: GNAT family N-acetyltransferase [Alphaproteobacteria bacterium]|nr:GNAT family N-acetyltransferase [Alphaproteobacteria bacterium]